MKTTINYSQFLDTFKSWDTYKDNFTYDGLKALFEYLEQYEDDAGEEMELDVVALCCDYAEYDSAKEAHNQIQGNDDTMTNEDCREWLEDNTVIIDCDNGHIIIQNF